MIHTLAVSGYRSLRDLVLDVGRLTVVTGPNGSGKSSLYRALRLLADVAEDRMIRSLALEGGLPSALWAGPERFSRAMKRGEQAVEPLVRKGPVSLKLGFAGDPYGFAIDLGLPMPGALFPLDPEIKAEALWRGDVLTPRTLVAERRGPMVRTRDDDGRWRDAHRSLSAADSMAIGCADPVATPELAVLRHYLRGWRFYDQLRTDAEAPARRPQVATYTPSIADDGGDLAAAWATIAEIGAARDLADAVDDAFPGARVTVDRGEAYAEILMHQPGVLRPLRAAELSDGTLKYLVWTAALLSPRPAPLMVLNEPEASLHPDLIAPLGRRIAAAARTSQVIVVTHAPALVETLAAEQDCRLLRLEKSLGETVVADQERTSWVWPSR